jgi:hypothetical protein
VRRWRDIRAHTRRRAAQNAAVQVPRAGGTGRRDRGHADHVPREGVGVRKFDERMVRRAELAMVVAAIILVLIGYVVSQL